MGAYKNNRRLKLVAGSLALLLCCTGTSGIDDFGP